MRYLLASFLAPIAGLALPVLLALHEFYDVPKSLADSAVDDAPQRGAGLFLLLAVPVAYLLAASFYASAAHVLAKFQRLSRKSFMSVSVLAPWALVAVAGAGLIINNHSYWRDLLMLLAIGIVMSLLALAGAWVWLFIALPASPPPIQTMGKQGSELRATLGIPRIGLNGWLQRRSRAACAPHKTAGRIGLQIAGNPATWA